MNDWCKVQHRWLHANPHVTPLLMHNQARLYEEIVQEQLCKLQHAVTHGDRAAQCDALIINMLLSVEAIQSLNVCSGERHHIFHALLHELRSLAMIDSSTGRVYLSRYDKSSDLLNEASSQIHEKPQEST